MTNTHPSFEALLPLLACHQGKTIVIKYGGNAMTDATLQQQFAHNIALLQQACIRIIVIHGGGPQVDVVLDKMGQVSTRIDGMRITDKDTMQVVEMVLGGSVNKHITQLINHYGATALGLTGKDGKLLCAKKLTLEQPSEDGSSRHIDLGFVGEVTKVNTSLLELLLAANITPVIAPIGVDEDGNGYNINADLVASSVAEAMHADSLLLLTNIAGVLDGSGALIPTLNRDEIMRLIDDGTISGGMIPKITGALDAIDNGVGSVRIVDGRVPNACLYNLTGEKTVGTQIVAQ